MTKDEIMNMPAGREMDVLIAEKIFGWKNINKSTPLANGTPPGNEYPTYTDIPIYSTDIAAAWEVVEKFDHFELSRWNFEDGKSFYFTALLAKFSSEQTEKYSGIVKADTMQLAICRAALLTTL